MDAVLLSRIQFIITIVFHYIFPQLTIGLSWLIVWMMTRYIRTGDEVYRAMARFWTRLFSVMFVFGVVTGITMEFQFGTNWAMYSRFVGDIFGAPLAAEVIFAFFIESIFLYLLVFGEKRLSPRMHLLSAVMVALGATVSAFWIVVANSWMQTPSGYRLAGGRAELVDFAAAVFNPSTVPRFFHVLDGTLIAGSFLVMGISARYLLKGLHTRIASRSLRAAVFVAFASSLIQLPLGHYHAVQVAETQPEKLATFEGLFETTSNAPLLVFGIPDSDEERTKYAVRLPGLLSFLVSGSFDTEVSGLKDYHPEDRPPLLISFFAFHVMVGLGMFFIALTAAGMVLLWKKRLTCGTLFLRAVWYAMPLPVLVNVIGWIAAETGRQPWIVYHVMRTAEGVSPGVGTGAVLLTTVMFSAVYLLLFGLWILVMKRMIDRGPVELAPAGQAGGYE